jgi:hypothetical protein
MTNNPTKAIPRYIISVVVTGATLSSLLEWEPVTFDFVPSEAWLVE